MIGLPHSFRYRGTVYHIHSATAELNVDLRGLEPLTFSMPWRRANQLRYRPKVPNILTEFPSSLHLYFTCNVFFI